MKLFLTAAAATSILVLAGCEDPAPNDPTSVANPAATFCVAQGNTYEIREAADGSQYGVCLLSGGGEIDAWEYFRTNAT
ncbi:hypothetical protein NBRC116594_06200 [Shimia sp. NS0008-38b]|uniref:putative hemolysin n=1 Tax=Shimia sp. NS0008-38b TaxID=3127653 RepID=UPI00310A3BBC